MGCRIHLINPSHVSFGVAVITPRWLYVLAAATGTEWGDPRVVTERLGGAVKDLVFNRASMVVPALSAQHNRESIEKTAGPVIKMVESLSASDPAKLAAFRREYETLAVEYLEENIIRQDYLLTRASKI